MTAKVCVDRDDLLAWLAASAPMLGGDREANARWNRLHDACYPKPELVPDTALGFEHFWTAYGRKMDRKKAKAAWDKVMAADVDPDLVVERARQYRAFCLQPGSPNQKHAATWLNGECWTDELEAWTDDRPTRSQGNRGRLVAEATAAAAGLSFAARLAAAGVPAIGAG